MAVSRLKMTSLSVCLVFLAVFWTTGWSAEQPIKADRVVVKKSERQIILLQQGKILFVFPIALGGVPEGDKLEEGDWRTPEGSYVIDWRNPQSQFYKSLHISYPDARDIRESAAQGLAPGGMIMIHGLPQDAAANPEKFAGQDWTDGCIALTNEHMDIVWSAVDDGTPIDILP